MTAYQRTLADRRAAAFARAFAAWLATRPQPLSAGDWIAGCEQIWDAVDAADPEAATWPEATGGRHAAPR